MWVRKFVSNKTIILKLCSNFRIRSEIRNIPLKKSIAIIEKWIDENRENDNETMPQVVDNNDIRYIVVDLVLLVKILKIECILIVRRITK